LTDVLLVKHTATLARCARFIRCLWFWNRYSLHFLASKEFWTGLLQPGKELAVINGKEWKINYAAMRY